MLYQRFLIFCLSLLILPLHAQSAPNEAQIAVWANEAIVATYTYNYKNFLMRQKAIAKYFTAPGWTAYSKALNDSNLPETVKKNAYYVNAVATMPPEVKTIANNHWQVTMPLLVVYKNPQYKQKQTLNVTIDVVKAPSGQGIRGFAVNSLQAKIAKPACKCASDT